MQQAHREAISKLGPGTFKVCSAERAALLAKTGWQECGKVPDGVIVGLRPAGAQQETPDAPSAPARKKAPSKPAKGGGASS